MQKRVAPFGKHLSFRRSIGPWHDILQSSITAVIGTICLAAGLFGYLLREARVWERAALIAAALLLIKPGLITDLIGAALLVIVVMVQLARPTAVASAAQSRK